MADEPVVEPANEPAAKPEAEPSLLADEPAKEPAAKQEAEPSLLNDEPAKEGDPESKEELTPEEKEAAEKEKKEAEEKEKANHAPEAYEDFKLPEGVEMDTESLEAFLPLAKELDLSQDKAQKLVDYEVEQRQAQAQQQWDAWNKIQEDKRAETRNDPEVGKANFEESKALAKHALKEYGNEELLKLFDSTGMGNDVNAIKFLVAIAKDLKEDKLKIGGQEARSGTRASRIYNHGTQ